MIKAASSAQLFCLLRRSQAVRQAVRNLTSQLSLFKKKKKKKLQTPATVADRAPVPSPHSWLGVIELLWLECTD